MGILVRWIVMTIAVAVSAYLLPGVSIRSVAAAFVAAAVLGLINAILRPLLLLLTLPLTIVTLGLFVFVLNALLVLLAGAVVPGFEVYSFWWALLFSLLVSIISSVVGWIVPGGK